jgi:hypothetical protein
VVVPPNAAETVALSNVSALRMPAAETCSMWAWLSTPPGSTIFPRASISFMPGGRLRPTAAMVSPSIATSAGNTAEEVATVPPRSTRS